MDYIRGKIVGEIGDMEIEYDAEYYTNAIFIRSKGNTKHAIVITPDSVPLFCDALMRMAKTVKTWEV